MNRLFNLTAVVMAVFFLFSCKGKDTDETIKPTDKDKILVNYPWRMSSVTDLKGNAIPVNQLNDQTQAIGSYMDIQFLQNNVTKALDRNSSQVINGGTWYLKEESKVLDINVIGFAGQFGVEELTSTKLRLKSTMPVAGVDQETIMIFDPVIK